MTTSVLMRRSAAALALGLAARALGARTASPMPMPAAAPKAAPEAAPKQRALAEVPRADVLVVPGGLEGSCRTARDTAVTHWVARVHATSRATASVCTGAWVLAAAGVLRPGDTAATHWLGRDELERAGVVYTADRVHRAGKVRTVAGVSAGLDLGLAMVDALGGRALAEHTQLVAQYDPKPPLDAGSPEKAPAQAAEMRRMHAQRVREIAARLAADGVAAERAARSGVRAGGTR